MSIELTDETRTGLVESIQDYFLTERGVEIGRLQASFFLDFILQEIGPSIYNQAIRDVQHALRQSIADLDVTLFCPDTR